jgi:predicted DNA-binding transcriptional regulator YafY
VRADRLVSLVLLLQARGRMTARALARELEVSVRTVYRDLGVLGAAGVPVRAESGPGGGCELLDGYRFPLRGLRPEEAEALLILGVPSALRELGLEGAAAAAQRQVRVTAGTDASPLVHLDLPRWFRGHEEVPHLRTLAEALRRRRHLAFGYRRGDGAPGPDPGPPGPGTARVVGPLGLVNKAGTWYLVAAARDGQVTVFRAGRISLARVLAEPFDRPADFELSAFWERWSAEFMISRPRLQVRLRASPPALAVLHEVFGDGGADAVAAAQPPDEQGWQVVTLSFEHELAAAHRLAGFGGQVEVLSPVSVRARLLATARGILGRYGGPAGPEGPAGPGIGAGDAPGSLWISPRGWRTSRTAVVHYSKPRTTNSRGWSSSPAELGGVQDRAEQPEPHPGGELPHEGVRSDDGPDHDDHREQQDPGVRVLVPAAGRRLGRLGGLGVGPGQVGEYAVQVGVGLGLHGLVQALVELGLVQPPVAVVLGQQVGHVGPLGVGNPQAGVAGAAAGGGQKPGRTARCP